MIRVELPAHLRTLARVNGEIRLEVGGPVTQRSVLDALETRYPVLCGTIRDHVTQKRRPFIRFFVCSEDWSHEPPDTPLPEAVASGVEPFLVVGAIAGGCRSIKRLRDAEQPATADDVNRAALQFVRKISGFHKPSKVNSEAFERAVKEISEASERLLRSCADRSTKPANNGLGDIS
jgi:hypothetical protein